MPPGGDCLWTGRRHHATSHSTCLRLCLPPSLQECHRQKDILGLGGDRLSSLVTLEVRRKAALCLSGVTSISSLPGGGQKSPHDILLRGGGGDHPISQHLLSSRMPLFAALCLPYHACSLSSPSTLTLTHLLLTLALTALGGGEGGRCLHASCLPQPAVCLATLAFSYLPLTLPLSLHTALSSCSPLCRTSHSPSHSIAATLPSAAYAALYIYQ